MAKAIKATTIGKLAGISDEAVRKATGKTWGEWGRLLDKHGCKKMPHKEIAMLVRDGHGVGPWWSQMVTVGYEQSRGLRRAYETCRGWQASVSRTVGVPISKLFDAWADDAMRRQWMGRKRITIRKATKNKSMRITWSDETSLGVNFYSKGAAKSQVTLQHNKLKNPTDVAKSKEYWSGAMVKLRKVLGV